MRQEARAYMTDEELEELERWNNIASMTLANDSESGSLELRSSSTKSFFCTRRDYR